MASECYIQMLFSIIIRNNYFEWSWLPLRESASDAENNKGHDDGGGVVDALAAVFFSLP